MNVHQQQRVRIFPSTETISCAACNDLLAHYLDAELAHLNVKHLYAEVWQHLQQCHSCATYHDWLYTVLRHGAATAPLSAHQPPLDLAFLPFPPPPAAVGAAPAWRTYLRPALLGEPFLLRISFAPAYLQAQLQLLTQAASPAPRALLTQRLVLPTQELAINLVAHPLVLRLGLVRLQATFSATPAPPTGLEVQLQWGQLTRVAAITNHGEANLGPVLLTPVPSLPDTPLTEEQFAITFAATL